MRLSIKSSSLKLIIGCVLSFLSLSIWIASFYELDILLVWWLILFSLFPIVYLSFKIDYIYIKIICTLSLITQCISAPAFYIFKDEFYWDKPFIFNFEGAYEILLKIFLFNLYLFIFSYFFKKLSLSLSTIKYYPTSDWTDNSSSLRFLSALRLPAKNNFSGIMLILFLLLLTPINFWMFSQGIGVVGVQPSHLPFKIVGVLFYFTKYIAPVLIFCLFYFSNRGLISLVSLITYSFILGLSSLSRFSFLFVLIPVIYIAILERNIILMFISGLLISFGYFFITYTRNFVYIISDGIVEGNFENGLSAIIYNSISSLSSSYLDIENLITIPLEIVNRVESFQNLVMAQFYDIYMVTTPLKMMANSFSYHFFQIDSDLHHMQWQGNILPAGFFNGGGLLSNVVILGTANLAWIFIYAFVVSLILCSFEILAFRLALKYRFPISIAALLTVFFSFIYFAAGAGTNFVLLMYVAVLLFVALPRFVIFNKSAKI